VLLLVPMLLRLQVEEFVAVSSSLLINMGTLSSDWLASKKLAAKRVSAAGWAGPRTKVWQQHLHVFCCIYAGRGHT
jgi:hypothetical protein